MSSSCRQQQGYQRLDHVVHLYWPLMDCVCVCVCVLLCVHICDKGEFVEHRQLVSYLI